MLGLKWVFMGLNPVQLLGLIYIHKIIIIIILSGELLVMSHGFWHRISNARKG